MPDTTDPNADEQLDDLQERIDDQRAESLPEANDEPLFIQKGALDDDTVDDTIAPPG